jgi:hypothetical protein
MINSCHLAVKEKKATSTYVYHHKYGAILLDSVPLLAKIVRDLREIDTNATILYPEERNSAPIFVDYSQLINEGKINAKTRVFLPDFIPTGNCGNLSKKYSFQKKTLPSGNCGNLSKKYSFQKKTLPLSL